MKRAVSPVGQGITIGEIASRAGIRASKLRYYESVGVLPSPSRASGQRRYDESVFPALQLVTLAQDAGFTIAEIRYLLKGFDRETPASARWRDLAKKKREDVLSRIEQAQRMKRVLDSLLSCECIELAQCVRLCNPTKGMARSA